MSSWSKPNSGRRRCAIVGIFFLALVTSSNAASPLVRLSTLSSKYGFPKPVVTKTSIVYKSKFTTLTFHPQSRRLFINDTLAWMNSAPVINKKGWHITVPDFSSVIEPVLNPRGLSKPRSTPLIMIDPGHGGNDTGAIGKKKIIEKKVVLDIAKRLRKKLIRYNNINVALTRSRDSTISLAKRSSIARSARADLFVSIHINSAANTKAQGIETYVLPAKGFPSTSGKADKNKTLSGNKHDPQSFLLAYCIHKHLVAETASPDRGIRRARFGVLNNAPCPAILVECGFAS
ncbi:MAG: N-acetylmuramoyl-L-alanine amidase, partial [Kiritimatiellae bacterium]|nr:N-acetylmuramoyl-L-alanine amidase [Kiritimatiellia bacterium]